MTNSKEHPCGNETCAHNDEQVGLFLSLKGGLLPDNILQRALVNAEADTKAMEECQRICPTFRARLESCLVSESSAGIFDVSEINNRILSPKRQDKIVGMLEALNEDIEPGRGYYDPA